MIVKSSVIIALCSSFIIAMSNYITFTRCDDEYTIDKIILGSIIILSMHLFVFGSIWLLYFGYIITGSVLGFYSSLLLYTLHRHEYPCLRSTITYASQIPTLNVEYPEI